MARILFRPAVFIICVFSICLADIGAQGALPPRNSSPAVKEIAVTFDDLPLNGPQFDPQRLREMTRKLLSVINRYQIPVVGFVNEAQLYVPGETDARIGILKLWSDAGVELGNHTFSHLRFTDVPLAQYEDDVIRGETVTRMLMTQQKRPVRYFRHPYLQMGATREIEKAFDAFLAARGYQIAPVTMDTMDWMVLSAYNQARAQRNAEMMTKVSEEYLKYAEQRLDFSEKMANELFGRPIKHIFLLHANELNADNFEALIKLFRDRGYQFISLEQALTDPVYQFPEKYQDTSNWLLHWSFSRGVRFDPPLPPESLQRAYRDLQK